MKVLKIGVFAFVMVLVSIGSRSASAVTACGPAGCVPCAESATCTTVVVLGAVLSAVQSERDRIASQAGSGRNLKPAKVSVDGAEPSLRIMVPGLIKRTSGLGEWTQLRNANIEIAPIVDDRKRISLRTNGDWTNGSRHAHWLGTYTLSLKGKDGKEFILFLMQEKERTNEWQKKSWETVIDAPPNFWEWLQNQSPKASVHVSLRRLK